MSTLAPRRIAFLLGGFLAVYVGLLSLSIWSGTIITLERALASGATSTMWLLGDREIERHVRTGAADGAHMVFYDFTLSRGDESQNVTAKHSYHAHNLVLVVALVLVTPGLGLGGRLLALVLALGAVYVVDVLIVVGDFLTVERDRLTLAGPNNVWPALRWVGNVLRYSQPTGGAFMVPVFVWGLLMLGPYRRNLRSLQSAAPEPPPRKGKRGARAA